MVAVADGGGLTAGLRISLTILSQPTIITARGEEKLWSYNLQLARVQLVYTNE